MGKTGTTSNYIDAWFVGFSSRFVAGVWTGFDNNTTLGFGETGSSAALPIWHGLMKDALEKFGKYDFDVPHGVISAYIDKKTGKVGEGGNFLESFIGGSEQETEDLKESSFSGEKEKNSPENDDDYLNSL